MKLITIGQISRIRYSNVCSDIGKKYLIVHEKSKEIVGLIKILKPPVRYKEYECRCVKTEEEK